MLATPMYPATISLTDVTSSLCIDSTHDNKAACGQVFVCQPCHSNPYGGLQIIQLEEEPAPAPRLLPSSSSLASSESESASGRSYWSSSYYSESACSDDDDEEEEEEDMEGEDLEEYCSSEEDMDEEDGDAAMNVDGQDEMDASSMKRILAWRADFYAQIGASLSESSLLKRKLDDDDEASSQSSASKRSRRSTSSASTSPSSLGMHACPACDTSFDTQLGLRQHGIDAAASTNDACCAAVEYEFE